MRNLILFAMLLIGKIGTAQTWEFTKGAFYNIDSIDCHLYRDNLHKSLGEYHKLKITLSNGIFKFNGDSGSKVIFSEKRKDGMYYYCKDVEIDLSGYCWEGFIVVKEKTITIHNLKSFEFPNSNILSIYVCYN